VLPVSSTAGRFPVTGGAVGAGVGTAVGMARYAHWRTGDGRRSGAYVVTGRALGVEIARIGNISVVIEILYCVGRLDVVTVVAGVLAAVIDVRGVAVNTHLGRVSVEGFMFSRCVPMAVTAPGGDALGAVLAEVTIEADVSGRVVGLFRIMAGAAGM